MFAQEIVPVAVPSAEVIRCWSTRDEHPRADTAWSAGPAAPGPARSRPGSHRHRWQRERPERRRRGLHRHHARAGGAARAAPAGPDGELGGRRRAAATMGIGPVPATEKALDRRRADADRHGPHRTERGLRRAGARRHPRPGVSSPTIERLNPHGSGISLGHPVGATGARILATLLREWIGARPAMGSKPCASAAARGWPRCSSGSQHDRQSGTDRRRGRRGHRRRRLARRRRVRAVRRPGRPDRALLEQGTTDLETSATTAASTTAGSACCWTQAGSGDDRLLRGREQGVRPPVPGRRAGAGAHAAGHAGREAAGWRRRDPGVLHPDRRRHVGRRWRPAVAVRRRRRRRRESPRRTPASSAAASYVLEESIVTDFALVHA